MKFDKYSFFCIDCNEQLDVDSTIMLDTKRENGDVGKIRIPTSFGNYEYLHEPKINFIKNELIEFSCPHCHSIIHSAVKPNFVNMIMRVEKQFDFEILFSRQSGVHKTYIVTEDGIESYGSDANPNDVV